MRGITFAESRMTTGHISGDRSYQLSAISHQQGTRTHGPAPRLARRAPLTGTRRRQGIRIGWMRRIGRIAPREGERFSQ